jgi:hypothetical protein
METERNAEIAASRIGRVRAVAGTDTPAERNDSPGRMSIPVYSTIDVVADGLLSRPPRTRVRP